MTDPFDYQSEPFSATGGLSSEGAQNQLGRPHLSRMALLIRESIQNSWDARSEGAVVDYSLSSSLLAPKQRDLLLNVIFSQIPTILDLGRTLKATTRIRVLSISDRGTVGMGGPTRADVLPRPGEGTNFVDFLRNIGQSSYREFGGGTYGFGKAAYYTASHARTICVYTRCRVGRTYESRFMAAALGPQFSKNGRRYTGRHWWGRSATDGVVDPLIGADADSLAEGLGMVPLIGPNCGTNVLILLPNFDDETPADAFQEMARTILQYFWPKLIDGPRGTGTMRFALSLDGDPLRLPRPEDVPPLVEFIRAFRSMPAARTTARAEAMNLLRMINAQRPSKNLGALSVVRFPAVPRNAVEASEAKNGENGPFSDCSHHVALMRNPNFVVRYLAGPAVPFNQMEYAGVFQVDEGVDSAFAKSEPPTHDDWVPDGLEDPHEKTYVRVGLRKIKEALIEFTAPPARSATAVDQVPLGAFSDLLGGLIAGEEGTGAAESPPETPPIGPGPGGGGGGRGQRHARLHVLPETRTELVRGTPALIVWFDIDQIRDPIMVVAEAEVLLEGGQPETEPPIGTDRPGVLEWRSPGGTVVENVPECRITARQAGRWTVAVSIPSDAMISVGFHLRRAGSQ